MFGQNIATAIQGISTASKAAGDASANALLNFIPAAETIVRALARVQKSWLELQVVARLVQRTFFNFGLFVNRFFINPFRDALLGLGTLIALTFDGVKRTAAQALAFIVGKLAEFAAASARAAKALPTDAAKELSDRFLGLAISARLAQAQLKNVSESGEVAAEVQRANAREAKAQADVTNTLSAALRVNAAEIEKNLAAINALDNQTGAAIRQINLATAALKNQTKATKDASAATRQATKDAEKLAQEFKVGISAFLAFDIDPSTGFGAIQTQLALIGPNAIKAGQDVEAAFEKVRASGKAIPPEQFAAIQKQTDQLRELIRIFQLLPESARASFDGQVAAIRKGTEEGSAVLRRGIQSDLQLRLQANATTLNATAGLFGALANVAETSGRKGFETSKAFRIAETIIAGLAGSIQVFANPGITDPFVKFAISAAILANTFATVQRIRATQPGSGGGGGGGGGGIGAAGGGGGGGGPTGVTVPAEAAEEERGQRISISVTGFIGNEAELASQLSNLVRDAQGDGVDFGLETSRG